MSYCNCGCAQRVHDLEAALRDLRYEIDALKRDIAREVIDRQDGIRSIRSDVSDLYSQVQS